MDQNPNHELLSAVPEPPENIYIDLEGIEIYKKIAGRLLYEQRLYQGYIEWLARWAKTLRWLDSQRLGRNLAGSVNDKKSRKLFNRARRDLIDSMHMYCDLELDELQKMGIVIPPEVRSP